MWKQNRNEAKYVIIIQITKMLSAYFLLPGHRRQLRHPAPFCGGHWSVLKPAKTCQWSAPGPPPGRICPKHTSSTSLQHSVSLPLPHLCKTREWVWLTASSSQSRQSHSMQKPGANLTYHWGDATDKHQPCQDGGDPWGKLTCNPFYSDLLPLWKCSQILWGKGFILPSKRSLLLNRSNHIF